MIKNIKVKNKLNKQLLNIKIFKNIKNNFLKLINKKFNY